MKTFLLFMLSAVALMGQELPKPTVLQRHYLAVAVGASFATGKQYNTNIEQQANGSEILKAKEFGNGKGFAYGLAYTCMINKNIGLELGFSRLSGSAMQWQNIYYGTVDNMKYVIKQENKLTARLWKFHLQTIFRIPYEKVSPYMKGGFVVSTGNSATREIKDNVTFLGTAFKQQGDYSVEYKGGTSVGLQAAMGIEIPISNHFFFVELAYTGLNHSFEKWEQTRYDIDGKDMLFTLPVTSGTYSDSQPTTKAESVLWTMPASSLSVMGGIKFVLAKP